MSNYGVDEDVLLLLLLLLLPVWRCPHCYTAALLPV